MLGYEDKNKKYDDEKEKDETEHGLDDNLSNHSTDSLENQPLKKPLSDIPNSVDNKTVEELEKVANGSTKGDLVQDTSISQHRVPMLKREDSGEIISASLTADAVESVAADWTSFRNIRQCVCSTPFDHFSRKVNEVYSI